MLPLPIYKKWILYPLIIVVALTIATPALADYLGPNRTVIETVGSCKIVLYECQFVPNKGAYRYHRVEDWSCSSESKPWKSYPSDPPRECVNDSTLGDQYWSREEELQTVTNTYPSATIHGALQNCTLQNGWCGVTTPQLSLSASEPVVGYSISLIEGTRNGQVFACLPGMSTCSVPLTEGNNNFTYWAVSSWGDSSLLGTSAAKVDTISPDVSLTISGANGANGWYVSPTTITAAGSDATSGLASAFLSVNGGAWQTSATLEDGVYDIAVIASDNAGNTSNASSSISVDTTTPSVSVTINGTAGENDWYRSGVQVSALASDTTSEITSLEESIEGSLYEGYTAPVSFSDGEHTIRFKAVDHAGNVTETPIQQLYVDTIAPSINLPVSWELGSNVSYTVQDTGSGLAALRLVIEDEDERYAKVAWDPSVSGSMFSGEISWDGLFNDKTEAPPGTYLVWVKARDLAGNERVALGNVIVPEPEGFVTSDDTGQIPVEPRQIPVESRQILVEPVQISDAVPSPPEDLSFPGNDVVPAVPPAYEPSVSSFGGSTTQTTETTTRSHVLATGTAGSIPAAASNVLWGSAAAAAIGVATAYALEEQRKREENAAKKAVEAAQALERDAQKRASRLQQQQENWARQQALEESLQQTENPARRIKQPDIQELPAWFMVHPSTLQRTEQKKKAEEEKKKTEQLQAQWVASYAAMRQREEHASEPELNWWDKTKAFVKRELIEPLDANLYKPYIKPAIKLINETETRFDSWFEKEVRQPHVQPALERNKLFIQSEFAWIDEHINQPFIVPAKARVGEALSNATAWTNEKVYQPYVKPALERQMQDFAYGADFANKKIYQPYIQPALSAVNEKIYRPYIQSVVERNKEFIANEFAWIKENIYQPVFEPVVKDINQYIYQPLVRESSKALDEHGEWIHGALDAVGFIPVLGELADGVNGVIYLLEGRKLEATLSALSMVPLLGNLGTAGKWTLKAGQELVDTAVEKTVKEFFGEALEKAVTKQVAEEGSEKLIKEAAQPLITDELVQKAIDLAGVIPGAGTATTTINSVISLVKGHVVDAATSLVSMVPIVGNIATAAKKLVSDSLERVIAREAREQLVEKSAKELFETGSQAVTREATEEILEKVAKETGEAVTTKTTTETLDQTVVTTANKVNKELREDAFIERASGDDGSAMATRDEENLVVEKPIEESPRRVDEVQFINSLRDQYGDEMVDRFLPFCEKAGIDPHEVIVRPLVEGQSLIGWALNIDNPANPVNQPLVDLILTKAELDNIREKSTVRPDSKIVVLGYGNGEKPYFRLSDEIGGCHLSLSNEDWKPFGTAPSNFWTDVNCPFLEKAIEQRKILLFNVDRTTIIDPNNAARFSLPELKLVESPHNNYVRVEFGKYELYVPQELQDSYLEHLPSELLGVIDET